MGIYTERFNERLIQTQKSSYYRSSYQSFMTSPEWLSVEIYEDLSKHLGANKSIFHVPYFYQIYQLWRTFFLACWFTSKESHNNDWLLSDYMVMDIFVVLFTTCELLPLALISCVLYPFLPKDNDTEMQAHLAEYYGRFVKEIEKTAFYNHDYATNIIDLKEKWNLCQTRTWVDWFTWSCVLAELETKGWVAQCLKSSYEPDPGKTDILVKYHAVNAQTPTEAINQFKRQLALATPGMPLEIVNEDVYAKSDIKNKDGVSYISVYARLAAPRYMTFKDTVLQLAENNISVRKIAGQDHVMVKCELDTDTDNELKALEARLKQNTDITPLFTYKEGSDAGHGYTLFKVPAKQLDKNIRKMEEVTPIKMIHNF